MVLETQDGLLVKTVVLIVGWCMVIASHLALFGANDNTILLLKIKRENHSLNRKTG